MLDTSQFKFNLEVYKSKDEGFERRIANRRMVRGLAVIAPLLIAALVIAVVFFH